MEKNKIVAPVYKKTGYSKEREERQLQHIADTIFADLFSQASARPKRCGGTRQNTDPYRSKPSSLGPSQRMKLVGRKNTYGCPNSPILLPSRSGDS